MVYEVLEVLRFEVFFGCLGLRVLLAELVGFGTKPPNPNDAQTDQHRN